MADYTAAEVKAATGATLKAIAEALGYERLTANTAIPEDDYSLPAAVRKVKAQMRKMATEVAGGEQEASKREKTTKSAGSMRRVSRAQQLKDERSGRRVKLNFTLMPGDRQTLREVQDWVNEKRRNRIYQELSPDFRPSKRRAGSERGTIAYETPAGWVDNVPAGDFQMMMSGRLPWQTPDMDISWEEIKGQANKLAALGFQSQTCRLCGKPIERGQGPEVAQIHSLLKGFFVLPYIGEPLKPRQQELRFRRLHLLHSLWEAKLVDVQLRMEEATDEDIARELFAEIEGVLRDAQQKRPDTTQEDVMTSLNEVLEYWEAGAVEFQEEGEA